MWFSARTARRLIASAIVITACEILIRGRNGSMISRTQGD